MSFSVGLTRFAAVLLLVCAPLVSHAAPDGALTKVRYSEVIRSLMYVPTYIALAKGFFRDEGLDVTMQTAQGTDKATAALLSGSADIALVGPEAAIYVYNSNSSVKTKIFAGNTATDGYFLMSRAKIESFDWNVLKGKEIMAWRQGSAPDIFLAAALRKHNIDPGKDVKLINNIAPVARDGAWQSGQADFGIFTEPSASMLQKQNKAHIVASMGAEVGQIDYTVFMATDEYIKSNPKVIQAWTNALAKGERFAQTATPAEISQIVAPYFPGLEPGLIESAAVLYRRYNVWKKSPLVEPAAISKYQDLLIQAGVLEANKRVTYEQVVAPQFAKAVKQ